MRKEKPHPASADEVRITRVGDDAIIEFVDARITTTHLRLGPNVHDMTDREILDSFNQTLRDHAEAEHAYVAVEVPPGKPQLDYFAAGDQWVPRGSVVRAVIDDAGPCGEAVVHVDDVELSLQDFGRLLCTFAGWGMRIVFLPENDIASQPPVEVRDPGDES
jgi:hypothetical protein